MNHKVTIQEIIKEIEECESQQDFKILLSDGDELTIGRADCWIGGEDDGWMCENLGSVVYASAEGLAQAVIEFADECGVCLEEFDY